MREVGHIVGQVLIIITIVMLIIINLTIVMLINIKTQSYQDRRLEALYAAAILRGFCCNIMIEHGNHCRLYIVCGKYYSDVPKLQG